MHPSPNTQGQLGAAVRRLRHEPGMTQEGLAFEAGVTIATLSRIERGVTDPAWSTVGTVSATLGITLQELVRAVEQEQTQHTEQAGGEPDDLLAQGARGVREREGERQAEVRQALEAYARRRAVDRDTRIIAELAPLIDCAKAAGLSMDEIGRLAEGKGAPCAPAARRPGASHVMGDDA
jgi:transcriptional regulator with XRE-family HTH domain